MASYLCCGDGVQITGQTHADLWRALFGDGTVILPIGNKMSATIPNNNTVRVASGACQRAGYPVRIPHGTYEDFTIPTGSQGVNTTYYLGFKVTAGSSAVSVEKVVSTIKTTEGSITEGDSVMYIWLYSASLEGVVLSSVTPIASTVCTPVILAGTEEATTVNTPAGCFRVVLAS